MAFIASGVSVSTSRFNGHCVARKARVSTAKTVMMAEMSPSIPFMEKPEWLDAEAPGYAGFDPLGFASFNDFKWMQEAEIKHGRICMLAVLGWIVPEFYHLPGDVFSNTNPLLALAQVPKLGLLQIVLAIIACEAISYNKLYVQDSWEPGVYGFDPLGLGKGKGAKRMQAAEIKNGRLAMIAIGGFIHQTMLTNKGIIAQLAAGDFTPDRYPLN